MKGRSMTKFVQSLLALKTDRRGITALEYGLIAAVIAVAMITGASTLGNKLNTGFSNISTKLT